MKKVKYRFFLEFEKEEKWINEMAQKGWHLEKFFLGRFTFSKGEPGKFIYRSDYVGGLSTKEKQDYFEFLKDSEVTIVHESLNWVYIKKLAADGPFEIYTDTTSKLAFYNRILSTFLICFISALSLGISQLSLSSSSSFRIFVASYFLIGAQILAIPIIKIMKQKKKLKERQKSFE